ncbi:MAG: hypothetical protein R3E89_16600 [Thiolinea sp.]
MQQQVSPEVLEATVTTLAAASEIFICGVRRMYPVAVYFNYILQPDGCTLPTCD